MGACGSRKALEARLQADVKAGNKPFMVVATAGTTGTGAVDALLPPLCERYGLWFHVDGAYSSFAVLSPDAPPGCGPCGPADSVAIDRSVDVHPRGCRVSADAGPPRALRHVLRRGLLRDQR